MPKASNYWSKNRRAGGNHHNNHNNNNNHTSQQGGNSNHHHHNGEKGGGGREQAHHGSANHHHHHGREGGAGGGGGGGQAGGGGNNQQGGAQNKRATPCVRSRSELRRILHDKLEWNEKTTALDLTLLVCADESDPAEAELIVVSSGCVATTTRYVRSDIVEAQRRREKEERAREALMPDALPVKVDIAEVVKLPQPLPLKLIEEKKQRTNCEDCSIPSSVPLAPLPPLPVIAAPGDELFRFDPSSKTHKCKVLNQIARSVQKAWCGLLFVPAYQLGQATAFIRALNPKPDSSHYVDGYISRLCCLEDLLWALRSARGLLNVEPPLAYSIWHSMREEDMAQLSEYSELTCTCVIATLHERAQSPPSLLDGSELWPSVVVTNRNCAPARLPWPITTPETTPLDELFNDEL